MLLPMLTVLLRHRPEGGTEDAAWRSALAAVVRFVASHPELAPVVERELPELVQGGSFVSFDPPTQTP
jgi:hypothetical protein